MKLRHYLFVFWVGLALYGVSVYSKSFNKTCEEQGGKVTAGAPIMYWQNTGGGMGYMQTIYPTVCEK